MVEVGLVRNNFLEKSHLNRVLEEKTRYFQEEDFAGVCECAYKLKVKHLFLKWKEDYRKF